MGIGLLLMAVSVVFSFVGLILFAINRLNEIENNLIGNVRRLRLKGTRGYV